MIVIGDPIWTMGRSKLLLSVKASGLHTFWFMGRSIIRHWRLPPPGKMTPWLLSSVLAGSPDSLAAKTIPPSIVSVAKEAGEPAVEKVDRPLVPSIGDIRGPF